MIINRWHLLEIRLIYLWHVGHVKSEHLPTYVLFNWENAFMYFNVNEKVNFFNNTLLNIFNNFCPHKTIVCNDNEPPWLTDEIKMK